MSVIDTRRFPAAEANLAGAADVPRGESGLQAANSSCAISLVTLIHGGLSFTLVYTQKIHFLDGAT